MNKFGFFFDPLFSYWFIALTIPLFAFLIWKEIKRNQQFLLSRIIAQLIVLISILGILLRPGFIEERKSSSILLLTPGYNKTQVDSVLSTNSGLRVVKLNGVDYNQDSEQLVSYFDLAELSHEIEFVLGEGLPSYALELMEQKKFQFLPTSQPKGIVQLVLPAKAIANQSAKIQGVINPNGETTLTLRSAGGSEDSVTIKGNNTAFELKINPKQSGLFVYTLQYKDRDGLRTEQIPIEVIEEQKLNILFLQKSPDFELRQLKNFLAERGHKLSLRYQVSKNNYRVEFANTAPIRITPLTSSTLLPFDLVILTNEALESLSAAEKNILEESIHAGLGMILIPNRATESDKLRERFLPIIMKKALKDTIHMSFTGKQYILPVAPLQVSEVPSVYPVLKTKSRTLSAYTYSAFGKVGVQFLQETYRIALEGNTNEYATIWSPLLEKTARSKNEKFKIQLNNPFPLFPDQPLSIDAISSVDEHPVLLDEQITLPLIEHTTIDNVWLGKTWAGKPGWHKLSTDATEFNYFISEPASWNGVRITNQLLENQKVSAKATSTSPEHTVAHRKKVPLFIYFLLFILASGYLWLAPKL